MILVYSSRRAPAAPAAAGPGTIQKTGGGTLAAPARTRPKREGARGGRGAAGRAVGRGHAAARAGRARTAELATARAPATDADSGPTRSHRGRAGSAVDARPSSGPPDARPARQSDAAPQLRRASRGTARRGRAAGALGRPSRGASRVFAALAALTGPKRWLCARAAPRSRKEASRRGSRSPTAASTRNWSVKGVDAPLGPIGFLWHSIV